MGFYSSWGRQFEGKGRPDPSHDVEVLDTSTGLVAAKCRTCGWRSVGTSDFAEADRARRRHEEQAVAQGRGWSGNSRGTGSLTPSDIEETVQRQYGDVEIDVASQDWVGYLVGSPNAALEGLLNEHGLVVQAAMAGEPCPDMRLLPDHPGHASRAALASAWAPDTSASELEKTRHWSQQRPGTSCLPLSPGYCPSLHAFPGGAQRVVRQGPEGSTVDIRKLGDARRCRPGGSARTRAPGASRETGQSGTGTLGPSRGQRVLMRS